jgi:biotin operon repressor
LTANYEPKDFETITVQRGQRIVSVQKLAKELKISTQATRTALNHLKLTNEITIKATAKYSIITVKNYDLYQTATNTLTNNQQTTNKLSTNYQQQWNKDKKEKNIKESIRKGERARTQPHGQFQNVFLTDEEIHELWKRYPDSYERKIERLSQYIESTGKRYDNHYATLLSWLEQDEKKETAKPKQKNTSYDLKKIMEIDTLDFVDDENFGKKKPESYVDPFTGEIVS